jgi:hypothetical protein
VTRAFAAAALAALVVAGGTVAGGPAPTYATLATGVESELVRIDPATLRVAYPGIPLGNHDLPWVRSPDRSLLAIGSGRVRSIRIVDLRRWRILRDVRPGGHLLALAWPEQGRLLAVLAGRCCPQRLRAVALDAGTGDVLESRRLGAATFVNAARTPNGLVLMLGPAAGISAPRLVVVDTRGGARSVRVDGLEAGWKNLAGDSPPVARYRTPGLAVDPAGRRALVAGGESFALVDLRTLSVRVRRLQKRTLADGGFSSGTYRRALWLRGGLVAVTGRNDRVTGKGDSRTQHSTAAGLLLVDPRTLAARRVDSNTGNVTTARGLLLATGQSGVTAYTFDGRRRYRALSRAFVGELAIAGGYGYFGGTWSYKRHLVRVLDLRSGRVARAVWIRGALTPLSDATPRICWC